MELLVQGQLILIDLPGEYYAVWKCTMHCGEPLKGSCSGRKQARKNNAVTDKYAALFD
jgi:hypothetical protein